LIIIVAIAIAGVVAAANVLYLNGVQDRANKHAKLLKVFVVAKAIPKGEAGETAIGQGLVKTGEIPERFRPSTALTDINVIRGKVSLTDLAPGQVIVDGQFVEPRTAQVTFSQRIPAGQVAVAITIDTIHAVDNLLVPGDKVDMIVTGSPTKPTAAPPGSAGTPGTVLSFYWQNVSILSIGTTTAPQPGETQQVANPGGGVFIFALPPLSAERLLVASAQGLTLALVPPDNQPTPLPSLEPGNYWPPNLTPYQP
jgi:pilus assembly protein CpaB